MLHSRVLGWIASGTLLLCAFTGGAQAARTVTFDDLDGVKTGETFVGATLDLSADGKHLAVERSYKLRIHDAKTGKVLHELDNGILPLFSPRGDRVAFYSTRSGAMQLWVWSFKTGQARQMTQFPGGVDADPATRIAGYVIDAYQYDWSADGSKIVFASRVAVPVPREPGAPRIFDGTSTTEAALAGIYAQPGAGQGGIIMSTDGRDFESRMPKADERYVSRLFIAEVDSGTVAQLDSGAGYLYHPVFSPDGKRVAFAAIDENRAIFTAKEGRLAVVEPATGTVRVLNDGAAFKHSPQWSPDGSRLAFLTSGYYGDKPTFHVIDVRTGKESRGYSWNKHVSKYRWAQDGKALLVSYDDDGDKLGGLRLSDGKIEPIQDDVAGFWAQARDGTLAWLKGHGDSDVFVSSKGSAKPRKLIDLVSAPQQAELKLGRIEDVPYRTKRGFALSGKLLYPPDYQQGRKYPLIVDAYPLTSGSMWMHPMSGNHAWAALGYMVFKPHQARAPHVAVNCSGAEDYCAASKGPDAWDVMVDDVMSGVDELIGRGLVDGNRMCAYGHSNGGGVVDYLITQTDRFKCAVVVAPVFPSWVGEPLLDGWWGPLAEWGGVSPLDDPAAYIKFSAVFQVKNVKTPLLLAVGDKDGSFLLGAIEMYQALRFAGKDVTFLRYPDQGHVLEGAALRDLFDRQLAFFAKHLAPGG